MSWKKFTAYKSSPSVDTYPSLPDAITWMRLFLGLTYGLSLGYRESTCDSSLEGAIGLIMGLNVIVFLPILYLNFFLNAQTDSYKALNFQGSPNALALMMLIWTIFFTMLHENEENTLANAVIQTVKVVTGGNDVVVEEVNDPIAGDDSEF
mmetsp:Transcript_16449/g.24611  ORF Transcript_16449/g.24611 Transcript_16449/m.24611 type:complete len:151 (-) Transcript_16449:40-492(-)